MASCVPVVVSDTLDYANEIARAGAGLSVPRDQKSFADAIIQLLDNPALRTEQGLNGARLARAYSAEHTGRKIEQTISKVVDHRPVSQ